MDLVCKGISKKFGSVVALKNADLTVAKGEVRALLGGNGSGKSTLAKILSGIVKKDKGTIEKFGKEYCISSPFEAKANRVVMTSQELSLLTNLTVAENLCLCDVPVRGKIFTDEAAMRMRALGILKKLKFERLIDKKISNLSSNEQYMIEFAKALLQEPEVLIIDEITSALYKEDVEIVRETVHELRDKGCIILFITHRMSEIFSICDSVTIMRNGQTLEDYKIEEVDANTLLSQMTGKDIITENIQLDDNCDHHEHLQGKPMLSIKNMPLKGFGTQIDLEVKEGEIIGITGLEGHGQSALVRQLFGLNGHAKIELEGKETVILNPKNAVKKGIAFISGDRGKEGIFSERSIAENATVVSRQVLGLKKVNPLKVLSEYNVKYHSAKHKITSLSGGNQQKVVIGRWLSSCPKVLLADDPTKGIDVQARKDVHEILCNLAESGSVVLMVSSDEAELISLAEMAEKSKVLVMYEGNIVQTLTHSGINKDNIATASMDLKRRD